MMAFMEFFFLRASKTLIAVSNGTHALTGDAVGPVSGIAMLLPRIPAVVVPKIAIALNCGAVRFVNRATVLLPCIAPIVIYNVAASLKCLPVIAVSKIAVVLTGQLSITDAIGAQISDKCADSDFHETHP
jgi:hypothetical protein